MNKVWVLGDAVLDLIPQNEVSYLKCPGGAPANVAVGIARLAGRAQFIGRVGEDPFGLFMRDTLQEQGVEVNHLVLDPTQRTSTVVVDLDNHGERSFTFMVKPSADQFYSVEDIPQFSSNEWLHTCSNALANEPTRSATIETIERVKRAGGFVSFDPNLRDEVWGQPELMRSVVMQVVKMADVVKFSQEELLYLTQSDDLQTSLLRLDSATNQLVIVTMGAKGALYQFNGHSRVIPSRPIKPVDTTGAGDAFVGGLLAMLSQYNEWQDTSIIEKAILWGNVAGGLATTEKGAMTALPNKEQIEDILSK
ncbi:aminoimidazole riboside kinase [Vibrio sp. WXL103]|uniref:aminoimidazole riboside kinase n=1 Tax=Vibrio sp. WXL103 TaxID=3450710 RepID=UPI003EC5C171